MAGDGTDEVHLVALYCDARFETLLKGEWRKEKYMMTVKLNS
jgi:hypothetical protein